MDDRDAQVAKHLGRLGSEANGHATGRSARKKDS
jgi:hypothetical protein